MAVPLGTEWLCHKKERCRAFRRKSSGLPQNGRKPGATYTSGWALGEQPGMAVLPDLKGDFAGKLDDSGARAEIELRAQWRLEWRLRWRWPQADGHGARTACHGGGRELGGAYGSIVCAVEGVVGFKDELYLDALSDRDVFSDSRIQRNEVGKVEGVTAESRRTVRAAVAVAV